MYQIRKGWPSNGAIDEVFQAGEVNSAPAELAEGMIVAVKQGKAVPAVSYAAGTAIGALAFVIGHEQARKTWVGLMSQCVIECDADHYDASATYAAGDKVTVTNGKFAAISSSEEPVGRVLSYDATTGILRVLWYESK